MKDKEKSVKKFRKTKTDRKVGNSNTMHINFVQKHR
jgi:hypothetical protein